MPVNIRLEIVENDGVKVGLAKVLAEVLVKLSTPVTVTDISHQKGKRGGLLQNLSSFDSRGEEGWSSAVHWNKAVLNANLLLYHRDLSGYQGEVLIGHGADYGEHCLTISS
jgi:hypothetical protein